MVTKEIIGKIKEELTPLVSIVAFQDLGAEIRGAVRYEINGWGYPVIAQATFRADREGNILEFNPTVRIGIH